MLALAMLAPVAQAKTCDVDVNGAIDQKDINLIMAANGTSASGPTDPRDADGDGKITVLDARKCTLQCSRPKCAINTAPVANNDTYTVAENTVRVVVSPGVLSNDTDAQGDALTAVLVSPPVSGNLTLNANGSFSYTPATGFNGDTTFTYRANDNLADSNIATVTISVTLALPPDPATVAPPLDQTVATNLATATSFLYTGASPIQTGITPGTIHPKRAAVLRGKVLARDNTPLPGVKITLLNHPELGQTLSRADGMFDLAVNGGGVLTVSYEKTGHLPVQRQINTPWQDYAHLPDVVMIQLDAKVTPVDLNAAKPIQVAHGSSVTDSDGTRRATLLFSQGTTATVGGKTLTNLNIRATEYTIGSNGPQSMPAALPPSSGYTYAVELSADEALGQEIKFSKPVINYVENFLGFPVGGIVPVGYYDRVKSAWIPSDNGRVIKILSVTSGLANLDTDGDDAADTAATLEALGVTDAERQQLATLYVAGQSLWRVPHTHFSPGDYNWPYGPPWDAKGPQMPTPQSDSSKLHDPDCHRGSIIECQNQVLRESIAITGTPFSLNYRSDRGLGNKAANMLNIPLSGATIPASLKRIVLEISVAGKLFTQSFPAKINQTYTFTWDGKDIFGRPIQGGVPVTVRIGYAYQPIYLTPAQLDRSFAVFSGIPLSGIGSRQEIILWQETRSLLAALDAPVNGWSITPHHIYDSTAKVLYMGNGTRLGAQTAKGAVITTVAGNGTFGTVEENKPASQVALNAPWNVAVAPDGSLYIADAGSSTIRRVGPDGIITTVAGTAFRNGFSGDGGLATLAKLTEPMGIAVAMDGSLYIAERFNQRIRRVGPDGIITTVAGNGILGSSGDGGPATLASLNNPTDITVASDGSLYIIDIGGNRIRRVGTDGIINTVVGNGIAGFSGDGGPASQATLFNPEDIAVAADGSLYIADTHSNRIRRAGPDGIITTVAGNGSGGTVVFGGDGGPAIDAELYHPQSIAIATDGSLHIADAWNFRIRRVGSDGIITTVAGNGSGGTDLTSGDGGPAAQAGFRPNGVAVAPDGNLYIADKDSRRIRYVASTMPSLSVADIAIASEDATEIYVFTAEGRHLRTLNALTGAIRYQFGYNSAGHLISITDGDGDITTVERNTDGKLVAIIAPDGQRTTFTLDTNEYLAAITNPAGEAYRMGYTADGLLTSFTDPKGNKSVMTYDAIGRLIKDQNAAGGFWALSRSEKENGYTVNMTSAESRTTTYQIENLSTGDQRRLNTAPSGTKTETLIKTDGTRAVTAPDGTLTTTIEGPDPRFSMQAPLTKNLTVKLPSGLSLLATAERTADLANPNDPLSLKSETNKMTLNGKTFTSVYDAALKQHTFSSPLNRQGVVKTDVQGRVIQQQITGIEAVNYSYDARGRLISLAQGSGATARTATLSYNPQGYLASITDPLGRTQSYSYDAAGRVTQQTLPGGRIIKYAYDANGNVTSLTPPGRPGHAFAYTPVDLESQYKPPAVGLPTPQTQYAYNLDKQLTRITRPDGQLVNFAYDMGGRLSSLTTPTGETRYIYTATTGQLSTITAPDATLGYIYDGALPISEAWDGKIAGKVTRSYNNDLALNGLNVNGVNIAYLYDGDGLLTQAGDLKLTRNVVNGLLTDTTLGAMTTHQSYNTFGELSQLIAKQSGAALLDIQYTRDKAGRITQQTEIIAGETIISTYAYDTAGRLVGVVKKGIPSTYSYDANGNRLSHDAVTGTYDAQDRLLTYGTNTYSYTANGELKTRTSGGQTTAYTYDVRGNLTAVTLPDGTKIEYLIDGRNRWIGKKVNGVKIQGLLYQSTLRPIAELDNKDNVVSRFVYATRINVPEYMIKGGVTYRIVTDHLGSPRLVVNTATGAIAQRIDYDAFGNITNDTNPGFQPFGFAGGLYDKDTKLVRFGARDYDAETGRWTAKDPIIFRGKQANMYTYAANNPINRIDLFGLEDEISKQINDFNSGKGGLIVAGGSAIGAAAGSTTIPAAAGVYAAGAGGFALGTYLNDYMDTHGTAGMGLLGSFYDALKSLNELYFGIENAIDWMKDLSYEILYEGEDERNNGRVHYEPANPLCNQ